MRRIPGAEQSALRNLIDVVTIQNRASVGFQPVTLLSFHTTVTGDRAVITLKGELDVAGSGLLEGEIERVVADHDPSTIVLDLSALDFMDSTGLRLVVLSDAKAREGGWRLELVRGNESVHRVFEITRMAERLNFVDPSPEAA